MRRLWQEWLDTGLRSDIFISVSTTAVLWISYRFLGWHPARVFPFLVSYDKWSPFLNTLALVASTVVGFVTTAIAIALTLGSGERGRRIIRGAGRSLKSVLQTCLAVSVLSLATLAIGSGVNPRVSIFIPLSLPAVTSLLGLNVLRLYSLLINLVWVSILDQSGAQQ
jgi:hypothetical protein